MDKRKINKRIELARWIARRKLGTLSEEEERQLAKRLEQNPEEQEIFNRLMSEQNTSAFPVSEHEAWETFSNQYVIRKKRWIHSYRKWSVAGSILLLLGISLWMMPDTGRPQNENIPVPQKSIVAQLILDNGEKVTLDSTGVNLLMEQSGIQIQSRKGELDYAEKGNSLSGQEYHTIIVPQYGEYSVRLADGTTVHLNAESTLRYPVRFEGNQREVWLSGQAYFEVQKDSSRRFVVHTAETEITVLGTTFDVEAYNNTGTVKTTLIQGKVQVECNGVSRVILPGQQCAVDRTNKEITVKPANVQAATAWMRGQFYFDEIPLHEIMDILGRWYEVHVVYEKTELQERKFSVEVKKYGSIDEVLTLIEETGIIKYRKEGRTIVIY